MSSFVIISLLHVVSDFFIEKNKKKNQSPYLEVAHHDESGSTDPACRETCRVENTVLVLLNDMGVAKQHDHHNCSKTNTHRQRQ